MTVTVDVTLSSGEKVKVQRLGLFEIQDNLGRPDLEPYTIEGEINGKKYRQLYVLDYERPKPDKPLDECEHGSREYWEWLEWHNWQDGLVYNEAQGQDLIDHLQAVDDYIKAHCISSDDLAKVTDFDDWDMVKAAAISEISVSDLAHYAAAIHDAKYSDKHLFDAFQNIEKANGSYHWIANLEYGLMRDLAMIESEYIQVPKKDRANMMLAKLIPDMIAVLDLDEQRRKAEEKRNVNV